MGQIKVDMDFMEDAWIDCPLCQTKRFDAETLSIHYKEKNIYDVLEMSVAEACGAYSAFFNFNFSFPSGNTISSVPSPIA